MAAWMGHQLLGLGLFRLYSNDNSITDIPIAVLALEQRRTGLRQGGWRGISRTPAPKPNLHHCII
jgi:hypothetical protein